MIKKTRNRYLAAILAVCVALAGGAVVAAAAPGVTVSDENQLVAAVEQAGSKPLTITLASDIVTTKTLYIPGGTEITFASPEGSMHNIIGAFNSDVVVMRSKAILIIENIGITHKEGYSGRAVKFLGTLTINDGAIYGNTISGAFSSGAGIEGNGTLIMNGGAIYGNMCELDDRATGYQGGGINMIGKFTMNGGVIYGNFTYHNGGGVYISGAFTMNGGEIKNNTAYEDSLLHGNGGGVSVLGTFNMNGGSITDNAAKNGGGVHIRSVDPGVFYDGIISGNTASADGGGIYHESGEYKLDGGNISDNRARNGGGVAITGLFKMDGGVISNNNATENGGGVNIENIQGSAGCFHLNDGAINNNAAQYGGGVANASEFYMCGGIINANTARTDGGGVDHTVNVFSFDGGWIYGNRENDIKINQNANFNNNVVNENTGAIGNPPPEGATTPSIPGKYTPPRRPTEVSVVVNGTKLSFDQPPVIENGRTLVPLRAIFEALGATVGWNEDTQTVTAVRGDTTVTLQIGSIVMTKNNEDIFLDVPAKLVGERTMVPARAVAESFGAVVGWDEATLTVTITT